jgi:aryl-alcohol dehydrogenase-like predicted oxidoreductase
MDFLEKRVLGRTGISVGRLGVASSFGAPAEAFEEAFERGCNYFYWGSMRKRGMGDAIRNLCGRGKRGDLFIVVQSYSRSSFLMEFFLKRALRSLGLDHADLLLFGWHNQRPAQKLLDKAVELKEKGLCRFLGISGHRRALFPELAGEGIFDVFHIRYNAAHRGAEEEVFPRLQRMHRPGIVSYTATRWGQLLNRKKAPPGETPLSAGDCYRFPLSNPNIDVCICGPRNAAQMKEALLTLDLGPLNWEELERVRRIGDYVHEHTSRFF